MSPTKVAYVLRRFPVLTETFVSREVSAVAELDGIEISIHPLLAPRSGLDGGVHGEAISGHRLRPSASGLSQARGVSYWMTRRPLRFLGAALRLVWDARRSTRDLAFAIACVPRGAAVGRELQQTGCNHIHSHFAGAAGVAYFVSRLTDIPFSFTPHAYDLFISSTGLRRTVRGAAFVVAVSSFHRGFLRWASGDESRHPVVHYGIPLDRFPFEPESAPAAPGGGRVVCVSTFTEKKGHRYLLEAFREVLGSRPGAQLRLVGSGPLIDDLRAQAEALDIGHAVTFCGSLPQREVRAELAAAHVLVQASVVASTGDTEGLPNTILEAMAAGVPVVATEVAAVSEAVRPGQTGKLVPSKDSSALAQAIVEVLDDRPEAARLARDARAMIEREFDIRASGDAMGRLFTGS